MSNEKDLQAAALSQEALDQVSGGVQAGSVLMTKWWDGFGNRHVIDSAGKEHIYQPNGTEITATQTAKKRTIL